MMLNLLYLLYILVGITSVTVVHSITHAIVATLCTNQKARLTIGFGKPMFFFNLNTTQITMRQIPLGSYYTAPTIPVRALWQRAAVSLSGIAMSTVLAFLFVVGATCGWTHQITTRAVISRVNKDGSAAQAGLQVNDMITGYSAGKKTINFAPTGDTTAQITGLIQHAYNNPGATISVTVLRSGTEKTIPVVIQKQANSTHGLLGVAINRERKKVIGSEQYTSIPRALSTSSRLIISWVTGMALSARTIIQRTMSGNITFHRVGGPLKISAQLYTAAQNGLRGLDGLLAALGMLSLFIAFINIIPLFPSDIAALLAPKNKLFLKIYQYASITLIGSILLLTTISDLHDMLTALT